MNLKKKQDEGYKVQYKKPEQKSYKQAPAIDWGLYEINWEHVLRHGKYAGMTLSYVRDTDDWYINWIRESNIISAWDMYKPKGEIKPKKVQHFVAPDGSVYVGIRECEGNGILYEDVDGKLIQ